MPVPFGEDAVVSGEPGEGLWWCFGSCSTGGDVFSFIQKIENLSFPEAAEKLARRYGLPFQRGGDSPERGFGAGATVPGERAGRRFFREQYQRAPHVRDTLARRGLTAETVHQFRLGYAPADWDRLAAFLPSKRVPLEDAVRVGLLMRKEDRVGTGSVTG